MHPGHIQCKKYELNAKIIVNTPKGYNKIVKFNFVISCLAFRSLISIRSYHILDFHSGVTNTRLVHTSPINNPTT